MQTHKTKSKRRRKECKPRTLRPSAPPFPLERYPELLRIDQAAAALNISLSHVRSLVEEGALVGLSVASKAKNSSGRKATRIEKASVHKFLADRKAAFATDGK